MHRRRLSRGVSTAAGCRPPPACRGAPALNERGRWQEAISRRRRPEQSTLVHVLLSLSLFLSLSLSLSLFRLRSPGRARCGGRVSCRRCHSESIRGVTTPSQCSESQLQAMPLDPGARSPGCGSLEQLGPLDSRVPVRRRGPSLSRPAIRRRLVRAGQGRPGVLIN